jgi:hypothetical protein
MTNEPWIFVRADMPGPGQDWTAFLWCRDTLFINDWDHTAEGYWFRHEQDAIIFSLKWL